MNLKLRLKFFFIGLLVFLLLGHNYEIKGQGFSNYNWYFGASPLTISFNKGAPFDPYLDSAQVTPYGPFGSGTGTDPVTGELIFYSDGASIFDASHSVMLGTFSNPFTQASQGVVVAPVAGNDTQYYVILNSATRLASGSLNYAIVDMSLPGNTTFGGPNLGEVISSNNPLSGTVSEALVVVEKTPASGGYWLYAAEPNTGNFLVYDVSSTGITLSQTISIGTPINAGNLSVFRDPATPRLIASPKSTNRAIQIFDIDRSTGNLSNALTVLNTNALDDSDAQAIFDSELSDNQDILFYSEYGGTVSNGRLLAKDLLNAGQSSISLFPGVLHRSYGLKRGPDGKIYHLYQEVQNGPYQVGRIENPGAPIDSIVYTPALFGVNRDFGGEQFPATLPLKITLPTIPSIEFIGSCITDTVYFFADFDPLAEGLIWDYNDTNFTTPQDAISPGYNYSNPGTYNVNVQSVLGGSNSVPGTIPVTIGETQLQIDLGQDTVICPGETLTLEIEAQTAAQLSNIVWSTGDTGVPSIEVTESGDYWVAADAGTCTLNDAIQVDVYGEIKQIANIWYFGDRAGLDFNQQPPAPLDNSIMNAPEGTATISDRNGQALFYTDGQTIYNREDQIMVNGEDLEGNPISAQSSIIIQFPGDETLFYVFTSRCVDPFGSCQNEFQIDYTIVDMKADPGGDGAVVVKNKPLFQRATERMTALDFGGGIWLITHEYGTNAFRAYPITDLGIQAPVISSVGSIHSRSDERNGGGYMKVSTDGTQIAVALASGGANRVELFDFDANTGMVSNPVVLDLPGSGKAYGVEFSPSSEFLYVTTTNIPDGGNSQLFQYHVDSTTNAMNVTDPSYIQGSQTELQGSPTAQALGALQQGPNGVIYVAVNGSGSLGSIGNPNAAAQGNPSAPGFNIAGQPLAGGTTSSLGLPNFIQNQATQPAEPTAAVDPIACTGELIAFTATTTSIIDMFQWEIFDSTNQLVASSTNQSDSVTLDTPGIYTFTVKIFNRCVDPIAILSNTVEVFDPPSDPLLPDAVPICDQSVTLTAYPSLAPDDPLLEFYDYLWSTGQRSKAIQVSSIGTYTLTVTDTRTGCTFEDQSFVGPPFGVDLGPDLTICEQDAINLDSQANADDYIWTINGDTLQAFANSRILDLGQVSYPPLRTDIVNTVIVGVIDPINPTCIVTDTLELTINPLPIFTFNPTPVSDCGLSDGEIELVPGSAGDFTYQLTGPASRSGLIVNGSGPVSEVGLPAGIYAVAVTDNATGCTQNFNGITITEPAEYELTVFSIDPNTNCPPDNPNGIITISLADISGGSNNPFPIDYILTDQNTGNVIDQQSGVNSNHATDPDKFEFRDLAAGTYAIVVTSNNIVFDECQVFSTDNEITDPPQADLQSPTTISECAIELVFTDFLPDQNDPNAPFLISSNDTNDSTEFFWSLDQDFATENDFNTPYNLAGTNTVFIKVSLDTKPPCDSIRSIEVTLTPEPQIEIVEDRSRVCEGIVTLTANEINGLEATYSFDFRWNTGALGKTITVDDQSFTNGEYDVTVVHSNNQSCFGTADILINNIPPPPGVSISSDPACTDQPYNVNALPSGGVTTDFVFTWFRDDVQIAQGNGLQSIEQTNSPGLYKVQVTNIEGCTASDSLQITVNDPTPSLIEPLYTFCPEEIPSIEIDPGPFYVSYEWIDEFGNLLSRDPIFVVSDQGRYTANLVNGLQCPTNDFFEVIEDCVPKIFGPNAFRPTSSIETNQSFFLVTEFVDTFQIFIYNRWGEIIYTSTDKDFKWDGVYNGVIQPAGVYTYIVKYTKEFGDTDTVLEQYGGVTLLR